MSEPSLPPDEVTELEFDVRRRATIAKVRRHFRRRALSRPITGWWVVVTRGDDGWR